MWDFMKKILLFLIILSNLLYSQEVTLDSLLSEYRDINELYNETKELKNGNVTVYSRSDLDKMQAYTLNDVLKTIKIYTLMATKFGSTGLVKSPYSEKTISSIKVYIDSYEVTSLTEGTGMNQFGRMGLNYIDHIEIYQASNAIAFNGEPGTMVIKLYTKEPSRENATVLQASLDSRGGGRTQLIEAKSFDDYTYLANIDLNNYNFKEYELPDSSELSRDGRRAQLYLNLAKKNNFKLELGSAIEKDNLFSGFGRSMDDGELYTKSYYVQFTKYFDNNIKLILNATCENVEISNRDSVGFPLKDRSISKFLEVQTDADTYNAILEKRIKYGDNNLLFGTQLKLRTFTLNDIKSNGVNKEQNLAVGPRDLNIYMFYFEDEYTINSNNTLTLGAKLDTYDNHQTSTSTQNVLRVAYLYRINNSTNINAFIQKGYFYPLFSETTFSPLYFTDPNLKSVKNQVAKIELEKNIDNLTLTLGSGESYSKDSIIYNPATNTYLNNPEKTRFWQYHINSTYRFDADNKVIIEYFKAYKEGQEYSPNNGGLFQLYNRIGKFDIYNELIYRSSYIGVYGQKINTGLDYTAGIIYHYSKKLDFKLKGENLFDRASQIGINGLKVAPYDRKAIFTMEYSF